MARTTPSFSRWATLTPELRLDFGNAYEGAHLLLLENGLYADDWSAFG